MRMNVNYEFIYSCGNISSDDSSSGNNDNGITVNVAVVMIGVLIGVTLAVVVIYTVVNLGQSSENISINFQQLITIFQSAILSYVSHVQYIYIYIYMCVCVFR